MVIVIGAGPAGLKLSRELKRRSIEHKVLEQKNMVAASFFEMPASLSMISPWAMNFLDAEDEKLYPESFRPSALEMHRYLSAYAQKHQLPIELNCQVQSLKKGGEEWTLSTSLGEMSAQHIVWATGFWNHPHYSLSETALSKASIPVWHFKDNPFEQDLTAINNILVIGSRLSAGQLLLGLLQKKSELQLTLSHRSKIKYTPAWIHRIPAKLALKAEALLALLQPQHAFPVLLEEQAFKLVDNKTVKTKGEVREIIGSTVYFQDQSQAQFDAVIFATGFRFQSAPEGVWVLGHPSGGDFRSRFLRGIRRDAVKLADKLQSQA